MGSLAPLLVVVAPFVALALWILLGLDKGRG